MEIVPALTLECGKTLHEKRGFRSTKIICGYGIKFQFLFLFLNKSFNERKVLMIIPCRSQILFILFRK